MTIATLTAPVIERTHPDPVLAEGETIVAYRDGTPIVRHKSGKAGLTFGVIYLCNPLPRDDREWFDPLGLGVF
jgi:hypothetical protein